MPKFDKLPPGVLPAGLRREASAQLVGVSPPTFDRLVAEDLMPQPKRYNNMLIWETRELIAALAALPSDGHAETNVWDEAKATAS